MSRAGDDAERSDEEERRKDWLKTVVIEAGWASAGNSIAPTKENAFSLR